MRLGALAVTLLVACGGGAKTAAPVEKPDPIAKTAAPNCKTVVDHLATLGEHDPTQIPKADPALRGHCENDAWSDDARSCFATAQSDGELDGCKSMLSESQRSAFAAAPGAAPPGGGGGAAADSAATPMEKAKKSGAAHGTRGPVPKGKTGDPDEGGQ
jgi:hypothetical protein